MASTNVPATAEVPVAGEDGPETEVLDEGPRSILLGIIAQLSKGMDLHRVTLPTFVLEPRSMLERITDFMSHPDLLFKAEQTADPLQRFIHVVQYYLSGWHIRPKGVKKPYNPVLGEFFRCRWQFQDQSESFYYAEQVSHHPPMSAFFYSNPDHGVFISGDLRPRSKFLGNSAATIMEGHSTIRFKKYPKESYFITMPNVYARGVLFGTMLLELGDTASVRCDALDLLCEIEFVCKGFFMGTYNAVKGKIKRISSGEVLYNISGKWTDTMYLQKNAKNAPLEVLFDATTASIHPKIVPPEPDQEDYESRRLWLKLTQGLLARDFDKATEEKTTVENRQRKLREKKQKEGVSEFESKYFRLNSEEKWEFIPLQELMALDAPAGKQQLRELIFTQRKAGASPTL